MNEKSPDGQRLNLNSNKSVKSTFDDEIFLVTKTTGTQNKSIGFTREEIAKLLPSIKRFLGQDNPS